jgi:hypothetical protein
MVERRVYVRAVATAVPFHLATGNARRALTQDPDVDLGPITKRVLGQRLRQASHFIELATIGVRLCLDKIGESVSPDMGVYVGTGLGELRKTDALFHQVFPPGAGTAAPFDFINATANMAAFYVARLAGASARNLTVTQGLASFELALKLACDDIRNGALDSALVGGVDESCFPRTSYTHRFALREDEIMGEGSAWFALSSDPRGAIAEIFAPHIVRGTSELVPLVDATYPGVTHIVCGARLGQADKAALAKSHPRARQISYVEYCGRYPTASGFGVASQLEHAPASGHWLHIERDTDGSAMLIAWQV